MHVVATESSLRDGMDAVRELEPALLIVDKEFGAHAVMDCIKAVREIGPSTVVIVWGVSLTEAEELRFLQAGASGVLRKTASLDTVLSCIRTVAAGSNWMEGATGPEWRLRTTRSARAGLTARELQVMDLVERGMRNREIALALGISTGTVKIHLKHIFEKTGIRGRYGLALSGLKEKGLLAASVPDPV